jgi:hypothetical protein
MQLVATGGQITLRAEVKTSLQAIEGPTPGTLIRVLLLHHGDERLPEKAGEGRSSSNSE